MGVWGQQEVNRKQPAAGEERGRSRGGAGEEQGLARCSDSEIAEVSLFVAYILVHIDIRHCIHAYACMSPCIHTVYTLTSSTHSGIEADNHFNEQCMSLHRI